MGIRGVRKKGLSPIKLNVDSILSFAIDHGFTKDKELDIENLIKDYKIDIKREGMNPEISGKLEQNNNKWCITINSKHSVNRQRYTLAHEFAHYCLHRNAKSSFEDTAFFRKEENKTAMEY